MRSPAQLRALHGPPCAGPMVTVAFGDRGARITVRPYTTELWRAVEAIMARWSYPIRREDTGAYACRRTTGGTALSLHSYLIAADVNWQCLAGDTLVTTPDGPQRIDALAGTTARLLTRDPFAGRASRWVDAPVRSFGEAQVSEIRMSRRGVARSVRTTGNHRWFIRRAESKYQAVPKQRIVEVTTDDLRPGDSIVGCLPPPVGGTLLSSAGVAAGNVYGDGNRGRNRDSLVNLYGDSMELLRFYAEPNVSPVITANGVHGLRVMNLPGGWKDRPPLTESSSYLLGWLAGYFAADGSVGKNGTATITSASHDDLAFFAMIASRVGIACGPIRYAKRTGIDGVMGDKFTMSLVASTVPERFFVRSTHQERFMRATRKGHTRYDYTVESVTPGEVEPVYCPTVEGTGAFALDGWLLTGNSNPYGRRLVTDMPPGMVREIKALRTRGGHPVLRWGGDWTSVKDAMHFECVASPAELAEGIATLAADQEDDVITPDSPPAVIRQAQHTLSRLIYATGGLLDGGGARHDRDGAHLVADGVFGPQMFMFAQHGIWRAERWVLKHPIYGDPGALSALTMSWLVEACSRAMTAPSNAAAFTERSSG